MQDIIIKSLISNQDKAIKATRYRLYVSINTILTEKDGLSVSAKWGFGISLPKDDPNRMSQWLDVEINEDTSSFLTSRLNKLFAISDATVGYTSSMQYDGKDTTSLSVRNINFSCEVADMIVGDYCKQGKDELYFCDTDGELLGWELTLCNGIPILSLRTMATIWRTGHIGTVILTADSLVSIENQLLTNHYPLLKNINRTHLQDW
jgi:hypothetical protein